MDSLSPVFSALADPTRRAILAQLSLGEATVGELSLPFKISAPAISRHIKVLVQADLIETSKDAQWRRCRLKPEGLKLANDWLESQREYWTQSFDRLEALLDNTQIENKD